MIIYPAGQAPKKKVQSLKGMSSILKSKLSEYINNTEKTNINHEFQELWLSPSHATAGQYP